MARRRPNVVLLGTDSSDSRFKTRAYAAAAKGIGLAARAYPDRHTVAVVPTSDSRALDAAWMCRDHAIAGPSPIAVAGAMSKSLTYALLSDKGFELLPWLVPSSERDFARRLGGPIIVKPDSGSGSTSSTPWGYRVFEDMRDFRRYLRLEGLMDRFLKMQFMGGFGRHLAMRYVESSEIYSVATVAGDAAPVLYDTNAMRPMPDSMVVGRLLIGERHPDTPNAVKMAAALVAAGLCRSVIYLQCVARAGKLYPIDLNLRPGAIWTRAAVKLRVAAIEELLSVILGYKDRSEIRWPAPYVGCARVPTPLCKGRFRVEAGDDALPLVDEISYDPRKSYDVGQAWPVLAFACARAEDFDARMQAAIASIRLTRLPAARR